MPEAEATVAEVVEMAGLHLVLVRAPALAQVIVGVLEESGFLVDMLMPEVQAAGLVPDKAMEVLVLPVMGMALDQVLALAPDMMIVDIMGGTRRRLVVVMALVEAMGKMVDMAMVKVTDKGLEIAATDQHPPKTRCFRIGSNLNLKPITVGHSTYCSNIIMYLLFFFSKLVFLMHKGARNKRNCYL